MRVLATDPGASPGTMTALGAGSVALPTLLTEAGFITLPVPLTEETRHLIGRAAIAQMKPGVQVINTARGDVIDKTALLEGLRSGRIAGAAPDTFECDPRAARRRPDAGIGATHGNRCGPGELG